MDMEDSDFLSDKPWEDDSNTLRIFLMGKTGSGKSATGNTILGMDKFHSEQSLRSITADVELHQADYEGTTLKVMDSPGLFDTEKSEAEVAAILMKAVASLHPGPHVLLYVLRFERFTQEENDVYSRLKALMDERIRNHIIVVFTHIDEVSPTQAHSIHDMISDGPENLKKLMADCGNRYVLFNNNAQDKTSQVADLMKLVMKMKNDNNQKPYQCPKYAYVTEKIEEETKKRLEALEEEEMRRKEHYRKLLDDLRQKEEDLRNERKELDKRAAELNSKKTEEMRKMQEKINLLEQQLKAATSNDRQSNSGPQESEREADERVVALNQRVNELSNHLQSAQNHLATKDKELTVERQKAVEINKQHVEINIMAEEKKELQKRLDQVVKDQTADKEEKNRLQEELNELKNQKREDEPSVDKDSHDVMARLNQMEERFKKTEQQFTAERERLEAELEAAQKEIGQLRMKAPQPHDPHSVETWSRDLQEPPKRSTICTIL